MHTQCENNEFLRSRSLFLRNFCKFSVKLMQNWTIIFLWFDENYFGVIAFLCTFPHHTHSVEITKFYCHSFSQKFRQINVLLKNVLSFKLIWRKRFAWQWISLFSTLHCATVWSLQNFCITWNLFREINYIVNSLLKKLFSRNFFKKSWYKKFVKSTVCNAHFVQKISWN